jgi:protein BCP1
LANIIISQEGIGSCLKQAWDENMQDDDSDDEDDDNVVFGIASVINLSSQKHEALAKPVKNLIIEKCKECANNTDVTVVENLFGSASDKSIGFIVNERYVNIPPQVSVPLLDNLQKEIKRAVEKKKDFKFDYYLLISKYHQSKKGKGDEEFYTNPEEELFAKEALCKFNYSVASEMDTGLTGKWKEEDEQLEPMRRVIIFEASKLEGLIQSINGFLTGSS